jgi:hypothetical protein
MCLRSYTALSHEVYILEHMQYITNGIFEITKIYARNETLRIYHHEYTLINLP